MLQILNQHFDQKPQNTYNCLYIFKLVRVQKVQIIFKGLDF